MLSDTPISEARKNIQGKRLVRHLGGGLPLALRNLANERFGNKVSRVGLDHLRLVVARFARLFPRTDRLAVSLMRTAGAKVDK